MWAGGSGIAWAAGGETRSLAGHLADGVGHQLGAFFGQVVSAGCHPDGQVVSMAPHCAEPAGGDSEVALACEEECRHREVLVAVAADHPARDFAEHGLPVELLPGPGASRLSRHAGEHLDLRVGKVGATSAQQPVEHPGTALDDPRANEGVLEQRRVPEPPHLRHKVAVVDGEIAGLVPEAACERESEWMRQLEGFDFEAKVLEERLATPLAWPEP